MFYACVCNVYFPFNIVLRWSTILLLLCFFYKHTTPNGVGSDGNMLCCKYLILEGGEKLGSFTAVKHTTLNGVGILITSIDTFIHFQMKLIYLITYIDAKIQFLMVLIYRILSIDKYILFLLVLICLATTIAVNIQLLMVLVYLVTTIAVNIQLLTELDNLESSKLTLLM